VSGDARKTGRRKIGPPTPARRPVVTGHSPRPADGHRNEQPIPILISGSSRAPTFDSPKKPLRWPKPTRTFTTPSTPVPRSSSKGRRRVLIRSHPAEVGRSERRPGGAAVWVRIHRRSPGSRPGGSKLSSRRLDRDRTMGISGHRPVKCRRGSRPILAAARDSFALRWALPKGRSAPPRPGCAAGGEGLGFDSP
jgi:hypothetical protein